MNTGIASKLYYFAHLSRWHEYNTTKVPFLFTPIIYILYLNPDLPVFQTYHAFLAVVLFGTLYLAFGYMVNDFADQTVDRAVGKTNLMGRYTRFGAVLMLAMLWLGGVLLVLSVSTRPSVLISLAFAYLVAIAYSCPPMHFKVRGFWGLLVGGLAQRTLPVMIVFFIFQMWDAIVWIILALYSVIGVRWMLIHQIIDEQNDLKTGVQTFVVQKGCSVSSLLLDHVVFPLEVALGSAFILMVTPIIPLASLLLFLYWGELVARWVLHKQGKVKFSLAQYGDIPLAVSYFLLWPSWLALLLGINWLPMIGIFVLVIVWQWNYLCGEGVRLYRLISLLWCRK